MVANVDDFLCVESKEELENLLGQLQSLGYEFQGQMLEPHRDEIVKLNTWDALPSGVRTESDGRETRSTLRHFSRRAECWQGSRWCSRAIEGGRGAAHW